jgi:hypothetical protein
MTPHLYDPQPRHAVTQERVPAYVARVERRGADAWLDERDNVDLVFGVAFVVLPLLMAAWGWSM